MKIEKSFTILAILVIFMLSFSTHAQEDNCGGLHPTKDSNQVAVAVGEKLDECGFQVADPKNIKTYSNPMLRQIEIIQPNEFLEYESAGQIDSPWNKGYVTQGWLVNSCIVVAPRHAIIGKGNVDKDLTNMQVDFKVGYQGKGSFKQQVKITPISCGHRNIDDGDKNNESDISRAAGEDFCIYKADRSLKGLIKPIKIGAIDFQRYDIVPTISVGFFPQASYNHDILAKDINAKIVDGDPSYLESRAANLSGAGLININKETGDKHLIGLQVGYFKVVNSKRVIEEINSIRAKDANAFKCN